MSAFSLPISQTVLKFQFVNEDVFFISLAEQVLITGRTT